ncbi:MAG: xanthine dehydrogenase family protein molybdopterin-binding subunit [Peptococcaceae bacterium]|jgi:xanthine dehydrogenase molybdenum-binding subunit|nr:xanthine dehydrogenase family protein molybdopterin-binding subunit [Peptococcaceae bacterium]
MPDFQVVGRPAAKLDAPDKVAGRAVYLDDLRLPGLLQAAVLRSPYPHARILGIDTARALRLSGVKAVITAADMPRYRIGFGLDNPPLKGEKVCCVGDEVAAVAAVDDDTAARALDLIEVAYEELPAVFDPEEARRANAPVVHPEKPDNVSLHYRFAAGEAGEALAASHAVVESRFTLPFVTACCLETHGAIASYGPDGNLTMWSTTQVPFLYQKELAEALGLPGGRIRVIKAAIGGGFGSKLELYPFEVAVAVLARLTGRPVKMVYSREEEFSASRPRTPMVIEMRTGADREGRLTARTATCYMDNGAYNSWGAINPLVGMQTVTSLYRVSHVGYDAYVVYTNNPYSGAVRGYGNPQATFAVESQMDMLAEELGLDPLEFRLRNANRPGEVTAQGMRITTCGLAACLSRAARETALPDAREEGKLYGAGLAGYVHVGGGARVYRSDGCGALVRIDDHGKVTLVTGATEIGQGSETVLAQIVAETLTVPLAQVRVVNSDTDITPWDVGTHASRTTFIAGNAALAAALRVKEKLLAVAAEILAVGADELTLQDGCVVVRGQTARAIPYDRVVRTAHFRTGGAMITASAFYDPPTERQNENYEGNISATYGFGAQAATVAVDPLTGRVEVLKVVSVHDAGRILNPAAARGQVEGGVSMGLGYALSEELVVEKGRILNPGFLDYRLLTAADMPPVEVVFEEDDDPAGPFGAKGLGETPAVPTAAAVANAVYRACGVRMLEVPITPERLLAALRRQNEIQPVEKDGG